MRETEQIVLCSYPPCGKPIQQIRGHRKRLYCDDVCRQRAKRARDEEQQQDAMRARWVGYLPETQQVLEDVMIHAGTSLADRVASAINGEMTSYLDELEEENRKLRAKLNVEARYLRDEEYRAFKSWLVKYRPTGGYPRGSFQQRFLDDARFTEPRYRRRDCLYRLEIWDYSPADRARFAELWKAMLLQS